MPGADLLAAVALPPALDGPALQRLASDVNAALDDRTRPVVLLSGGAEGFCRGMDLGWLTGGEPPAAGLDAFAGLLERIRYAAKPVIAAVDGQALGGGLGLAAACDVVLATARSTFGLPELLFGFIPATILPVLLERAAVATVRRLAISGGSIDAAEAQRVGLVDELVVQDGLESAAQAWARRLSRAQPEAVGQLKRCCAEAGAGDLGPGIRRGAQLTTQALADAGVMGRIRAYVAEGVAPWLEP